MPDHCLYLMRWCSFWYTQHLQAVTKSLLYPCDKINILKSCLHRSISKADPITNYIQLS